MCMECYSLWSLWIICLFTKLAAVRSVPLWIHLSILVERACCDLSCWTSLNSLWFEKWIWLWVHVARSVFCGWAEEVHIGPVWWGWRWWSSLCICWSQSTSAGHVWDVWITVERGRSGDWAASCAHALHATTNSPIWIRHLWNIDCPRDVFWPLVRLSSPLGKILPVDCCVIVICWFRLFLVHWKYVISLTNDITWTIYIDDVSANNPIIGLI